MTRERLKVLLLSVALLVPCFWQSRIQAGDLSSHLYNAWLSNEIEAGRGSGLVLAHPWTNVLVDWMLAFVMRAGGPALAEHVVVPALVLVLFWGAMAWIRAVKGEWAWATAPCVAMLAYGWVFHMGFLNFYLSTGLMFWALALLWAPTGKRAAAAVLLMLLAALAHSIPVLWGVVVLGYLWTGRRLPERWQSWLPAAALVLVGLFVLYLTARFRTLSTSNQILEMVGIDQVWVFGVRYVATAVLLGMLWAFQMLRLLYSRPMSALLRNIPFQLCVVMSVAILAMPTLIDLPMYRTPLSFVTERMTLPFAVLLCATLAQMPPVRWQSMAMAGLAVLQFLFLYGDTASLNRWEDRLDAAVAQVPRGMRVVAALEDPNSRVPLWYHAIDRACIGRCYSYQNYEPSSWQFRVRALEPNALVMDRPIDASAAQQGAYTARRRDLPLYQVVPCGAERLCVQPMADGERQRPAVLPLVRMVW